MKHGIVSVVVVGMIIAVSSQVKAEEVPLDFDGALGRSVSFESLVEASDVPQLVPSLEQDSLESARALSLYVLPEMAQLELKAKMENAPGVYDEDALKAISDESTRIFFDGKRLLFVRPVAADKYSLRLESDSPELLRLASEIISGIPMSRQAVTICKIAEVVVQHCLWKVIDGTAKLICEDVKELVKECHTEDVPEPPSSGTTYHNNSGGDSNYDVNKHLK